MVAFEFSVRGYTFQEGVRTLRNSFDTANLALTESLNIANAKVDRFDAEVKAGTLSDEMITGDDAMSLEDYRDWLIWDTLTGEEALNALNKSFAITVFHQWERSAREWCGRPNGKFATLCEDVMSKGLSIDAKLAQLHALVNLLKHGNAKWGIELHSIRPDYFKAGFDPAASEIDWYDEVILDHTQIEEMFTTVQNSGPSINFQFPD
jgi:hypothetical protein